MRVQRSRGGKCTHWKALCDFPPYRLTADFRKRFLKLPNDVQSQAKETYRLWKIDPYHAGLFFKQVSPNQPLFSVRIEQHWRALAIKGGNDLDWFWIGPHSHYDRLIKQI